MILNKGDRLWSEVIQIVKYKKAISSFKGKAHASIQDVTDNFILLVLEDAPTTKNTTIKLSKLDFVNAISLLYENEGIRQKDLDPRKARYLLSILSLLPYFKSEHRTTNDHGKTKKTKFLVCDDKKQQLFGA